MLTRLCRICLTAAPACEPTKLLQLLLAAAANDVGALDSALESGGYGFVRWTLLS